MPIESLNRLSVSIQDEYSPSFIFYRASGLVGFTTTEWAELVIPALTDDDNLHPVETLRFRGTPSQEPKLVALETIFMRQPLAVIMRMISLRDVEALKKYSEGELSPFLNQAFSRGITLAPLPLEVWERQPAQYGLDRQRALSTAMRRKNPNEEVDYEPYKTYELHEITGNFLRDALDNRPDLRP